MQFSQKRALLFIKGISDAYFGDLKWRKNGLCIIWLLIKFEELKMERIKYIFCFIFLSIVCISCHEGCDDSTYFNGKIRIIEDNSKAVKKVSLKNVILNGANFGYIAVYDSLMFF